VVGGAPRGRDGRGPAAGARAPVAGPASLASAAQESRAEGRGLVPPPSLGEDLRRDVPCAGRGRQDGVCRKFRGPGAGGDSLRAVPSGTILGERAADGGGAPGEAGAPGPQAPAPSRPPSRAWVLMWLHLGSPVAPAAGGGSDVMSYCSHCRVPGCWAVTGSPPRPHKTAALSQGPRGCLGLGNAPWDRTQNRALPLSSPGNQPSERN
jgi:hypothetical protein